MWTGSSCCRRTRSSSARCGARRGCIHRIASLASGERNRRRLDSIDNVMAQAIKREFEPVGDAQLVIHLAQVVLHDLLGRAHANRNLFVLHALGDAGNDQGFLGRELDFGARSRGPQVVSAIGFHHPMDGLALEPGLARGNFAEAFDQYFGLCLARQNAVGSAAEQIERELFVRSGCDYYNLQLRRLAQQFRHGFDRIRRQGRLENQDVSGKLRHCRLCLRQRLGLADNADVVFEGEDLAQSRAEDGLGVGQDHANQLAGAAARVSAVIFSLTELRAIHQFACTYALSKLYSSITTPTPRRPLSSKLRTTRPWQSICTSQWDPTTSPGSKIVKSTIEPTGTSRSIAKSTPLAEIFCVSAA